MEIQTKNNAGNRRLNSFHPSLFLVIRSQKNCNFGSMYNTLLLLLLFEPHFAIKKVDKSARIALWKANKLFVLERQ